MADAQGLSPGDTGYDPSTDPTSSQYNGGSATPQSSTTPTSALTPGASQGPPSAIGGVPGSVAPGDEMGALSALLGKNAADPQKAVDLFNQAFPNSTLRPQYYPDRKVIGVAGQRLPYLTAPGTTSGQTTWQFGGVPGGDPGGTGGGTTATDPTTFGKLLQGFPGYQAPTGPPAPLDLPGYEAPKPFGSYTLPTGDQVRQTPGYQFGLDQSIQGFTNAKAAQGVARTGGTLANILDLAGNYADQHYGDYVNQDMAGYNANRETYATNEAGRLGAYTANNAARQQVASAQRQGYLDQYGIWRNTNNDQFGYLDALYGTGAGAAATA